jgi:polyisoprenoid-binding protein YceI
MKLRPAASTVLTTWLALALAACGRSPETQADAAPAAEESADLESSAAAGMQDVLTLEVAPTGNTARYRVREQLVGVDLPNDAIGVTTAVSGRVVIDDAGSIVPAQSEIVVNVSGLESDKSRRDGYVRDRLLRTEEHPTVTLRPTALRGLPKPVPTSGTHTFELDGDLTVMGVTRPTTWHVTATIDAGRVTGTAATRFTFEDYNMTKPRVRVVLSVADSIGLEYDFNLVAR